MKKLIQTVVKIIFGILILAVFANEMIRESDGSGKSIGIIEEKLFGKSIFDVLLPPS